MAKPPLGHLGVDSATTHLTNGVARPPPQLLSMPPTKKIYYVSFILKYALNSLKKKKKTHHHSQYRLLQKCNNHCPHLG
jgi:hypothetical protein